MDRDLTGLGTPEGVWAASRLPERLPPWEYPDIRRVVVVAPHPDDEILGPGGTAISLHRRGTALTVVAVTDGEASHPDSAERLRDVRPRESAAARAAAGLANVVEIRLRHADGAVDERALRDQLVALLRPDDLVLAPWEHDGHPDHDAAGRAALSAAHARNVPVAGWLVWTWHWARPDCAEVPWSRARLVALDPFTAHAKKSAAACFESQLGGPTPILPPPVLARLLRPYEVLIA